MMGMLQQQAFGKTADGQQVTRFLLSDGTVTAAILDFGGTVQSVLVPNRQGTPTDVALGYDTIADYERQDKFLSALIGRCANRIARGTFSLDGKAYSLRCNDGRNHLHGGHGFDKRLWQADVQDDQLVLTLESDDGDEGYPGALSVQVTYALQNGALSITYEARAAADTLCNLTNHTYWNLAGHDAGTVGGHLISLCADAFTPVDAEAIPTGALSAVEGTPFDLRCPTPIGLHWDDTAEQLTNVGGYDHNFIVNGATGGLRAAAAAHCEQTGIRMEVETTMPGLQFYTGNALAGAPLGKGGCTYGRRHGFCLETQFYPDAIHHPRWPQPILRAGEAYRQQTVYRFSVHR